MLPIIPIPAPLTQLLSSHKLSILTAQYQALVLNNYLYELNVTSTGKLFLTLCLSRFPSLVIFHLPSSKFILNTGAAFYGRITQTPMPGDLGSGSASRQREQEVGGSKEKERLSSCLLPLRFGLEFWPWVPPSITRGPAR